jgi:ribosomal protein L29
LTQAHLSRLSLEELQSLIDEVDEELRGERAERRRDGLSRTDEIEGKDKS